MGVGVGCRGLGDRTGQISKQPCLALASFTPPLLEILEHILFITAGRTGVRWPIYRMILLVSAVLTQPILIIIVASCIKTTDTENIDLWCRPHQDERHQIFAGGFRTLRHQAAEICRCAAITAASDTAVTFSSVITITVAPDTAIAGCHPPRRMMPPP
jgi:hypothetical protein